MWQNKFETCGLLFDTKPCLHSHGNIKYLYSNVLVDFFSTVSTTSVNVVRSQSTQTIYIPEQLDLTCTTLLSSYVDTPVIVTHNWEGPLGVVTADNDSNITISEVTGFNLQYSSTLSFNSLRLSDSGIYTCISISKPVYPLSVTPSSIDSSFTFFNTG